MYWAKRYGEPYSSTKPTFEQWNRGNLILSVLVPPYGLCRYYQWRKYSNTTTTSTPSPAPVNFSIRDSSVSIDSVSVMGVPVIEPGANPINQLSKNLEDSFETKPSPFFSAYWFLAAVSSTQAGCAGSCGTTGGCAAGSCGASGCGGSCGGYHSY